MAVVRSTFRYAIISILLIMVWSIVYLMNGSNLPYVHAFYFPITLASRFWGIKGGIVVGVLAGLLSGPFMPHHVIEDVPQPPSHWFVRLSFFIIFGVFVGKFFSVLAHKKGEVHSHKKDLEIKNEEIIGQRDEIIKHRNEIEKQRDEIEIKQEKIRQFGSRMIEALVRSIEVRDSFTSGHCRRVSDMSVRIGERLGLEQQELLDLKWSSMLHDIGKIGIPEEILTKPGKLTPYEYDVMKQHPGLGAKILSGIPYADRILEGVLHHHERMDGKGYPHGLSGNDIGMQARIIAVSDVWDALISKRSYRDAVSHSEALEIMKAGRGTHFDPLVLDPFLDIVDEDREKEPIDISKGNVVNMNSRLKRHQSLEKNSLLAYENTGL
jgi:HD-GYP domain-containing protein (c-di-GMP phosphodiesterase class II)